MASEKSGRKSKVKETLRKTYDMNQQTDERYEDLLPSTIVTENLNMEHLATRAVK